MEKLYVEASLDTPKVNFDPENSVFEISGKALPEDAIEFFRPLYDWMAKYLESSDVPVTVNLDLAYLNSSSTRYIFNILSLLEDAHEEGREVSVKWRASNSDEVMIGKGEEMKEMLDVPVVLEKY